MQLISLIKQNFLKRDFISYCIVGVIGLVVDVSVYYISYSFFSLSYAVSNIISSHAGVVNNFVLNSIFTFKTKDKIILRFLQFYGIAFLGMILSTYLIILFTDVILMHPLIAKLFALGIVTILQFLSNKYITFRKNK